MSATTTLTALCLAQLDLYEEDDKHNDMAKARVNIISALQKALTPEENAAYDAMTQSDMFLRAELHRKNTTRRPSPSPAEVALKYIKRELEEVADGMVEGLGEASAGWAARLLVQADAAVVMAAPRSAQDVAPNTGEGVRP